MKIKIGKNKDINIFIPPFGPTFIDLGDPKDDACVERIREVFSIISPNSLLPQMCPVVHIENDNV
jgi:hypothetical protein